MPGARVLGGRAGRRRPTRRAPEIARTILASQSGVFTIHDRPKRRHRDMSSVAATQDGSFQTDVLESEIPVLVDFWAEWCGPCRQLGPIIDQVGTELAGKVKVLKLNVDENPAVTQRFGIQSIPTIMLFSGGQARGQIVGLRPKNDILRQIESVLGVKA